MRHRVPQSFGFKPRRGWVVALALLFSACSPHQKRPRAQYVSLTELETILARLSRPATIRRVINPELEIDWVCFVTARGRFGGYPSPLWPTAPL